MPTRPGPFLATFRCCGSSNPPPSPATAAPSPVRGVRRPHARGLHRRAPSLRGPRRCSTTTPDRSRSFTPYAAVAALLLASPGRTPSGRPVRGLIVLDAAGKSPPPARGTRGPGASLPRPGRRSVRGADELERARPCCPRDRARGRAWRGACTPSAPGRNRRWWTRTSGSWRAVASRRSCCPRSPRRAAREVQQLSLSILWRGERDRARCRPRRRRLPRTDERVAPAGGRGRGMPSTSRRACCWRARSSPVHARLGGAQYDAERRSGGGLRGGGSMSRPAGRPLRRLKRQS